MADQLLDLVRPQLRPRSDDSLGRLADQARLRTLLRAPAETVQLALLPFTAPSELGPAADAVLRDTADQLARVKSNRRTRFVFIPLGATLRRRVRTPEQARVALGASEVLSATLVQDKDRIRLHASISDVRSKTTVRDWDTDYPPAKMKYAGVAMAAMVTMSLHLPALVPKAAVNTAASLDYAAGLAAVRRDTGIDTAIAHFERAVAADPDSPLPYAGLAEAEWFKFYLTKDKLWIDRATESVRQAEARNADLAEVQRIGGLLKANAGWYEQAVAEYQRAIELDPANGDAYRRLGSAYESNSQLDQAASAYQKAVEASPAGRPARPGGGTGGNRQESPRRLRPLLSRVPCGGQWRPRPG